MSDKISEELVRETVREHHHSSKNDFKITSREKFDSPVWNFFDPPIRVKSIMTSRNDKQFHIASRLDRYRDQVKKECEMVKFCKPVLRQQYDWIEDHHWIQPSPKDAGFETCENSKKRNLNLFDQVFSPLVAIHKVDETKKKEVFTNFDMIHLLSKEKISENLKMCEEIKTQMISSMKRALEDMEKVMGHQIETFNSQVLKRYEERKKVLDEVHLGTFEERLGKFDVQLKSSTTPLTKIILNCSDVLRIIISFLTTKDIIQRIIPMSTYFYSYVRKNVSLELAIESIKSIDRIPLSTILSKFRVSKLQIGRYSPFSALFSNRVNSLSQLVKFLKCSTHHQHDLREIKIYELEKFSVGKIKPVVSKFPYSKDRPPAQNFVLAHVYGNIDPMDKSARKNRLKISRIRVHQIYNLVNDCCPRLEHLEVNILPSSMDNLMHLKRIIYPINYLCFEEKFQSGPFRRYHYRTLEDIEALITYFEQQRRPYMEELSLIDIENRENYLRNPSPKRDMNGHRVEEKPPAYLPLLRRLNESVRNSCSNLTRFKSRLFFDFRTMSLGFLKFLSGVKNEVFLVYNGEFVGNEYNGQNHMLAANSFFQEEGSDLVSNKPKWINVEEEEEEESENLTKKKEEKVYPNVKILNQKSEEEVQKKTTSEEEEKKKPSGGSQQFVSPEKQSFSDGDDGKMQQHNDDIITPPQNIINMRNLLSNTGHTPVRNLDNEEGGYDEHQDEENMSIDNNSLRGMIEKKKKNGKLYEMEKIYFFANAIEHSRRIMKCSSQKIVVFDLSRNKRDLEEQDFQYLGGGGGNGRLNPFMNRSKYTEFMDDLIMNISTLTYRLRIGLDSCFDKMNEEEELEEEGEGEQIQQREEEEEVRDFINNNRRDVLTTSLISVINNKGLKNMSSEGLELEIGFRNGDIADGDIYYERSKKERKEIEEGGEEDFNGYVDRYYRSKRIDFHQVLVSCLKERVVKRAGLKRLKLKVTYLDRGRLLEEARLKAAAHFFDEPIISQSEREERERNDYIEHLEREFYSLPKVVMKVLMDEKESTSVENVSLNLVFSYDCFMQINDVKRLIYGHIMVFMKEFGRKKKRRSDEMSEKKVFEVKIGVAEILMGEIIRTESGKGKMVVRPGDRDGTILEEFLRGVSRDVREFLHHQRDCHEWDRVNFVLKIFGCEEEVNVKFER